MKYTPEQLKNLAEHILEGIAESKEIYNNSTGPHAAAGAFGMLRAHMKFIAETLNGDSVMSHLLDPPKTNYRNSKPL